MKIRMFMRIVGVCSTDQSVGIILHYNQFIDVCNIHNIFTCTVEAPLILQPNPLTFVQSALRALLSAIADYFSHLWGIAHHIQKQCFDCNES